MYTNYRNRRLQNNIGYQNRPIKTNVINQFPSDLSSKLYYNQYGEPYINRSDYDGVHQLGSGVDNNINAYKEAYDMLNQTQNIDIELNPSKFKEDDKLDNFGVWKNIDNNKLKDINPRDRNPPSEKIIKQLRKKAYPSKARTFAQSTKYSRKSEGSGIKISENIEEQIKNEKLKKKDILTVPEVKKIRRPTDPLHKLKRKIKKNNYNQSVDIAVNSIINRIKK